jgi:hypothetical protein
VTPTAVTKISADVYANNTRTAYLALYPALRVLDVFCPACSAESLRSCLTDGQSVPAHPARVDLAARVTKNRLADSGRAAEAARSVHTRLAAGITPGRMSRYVAREYRVAYLMAYGWQPLYCTPSSPWRSPYRPMPDRYSMAFAFGWLVQEHAGFIGPDGVANACVNCKVPGGHRDRHGVPRCPGCADWMGVPE